MALVKSIEIKYTALNLEEFALVTAVAAQWLAGKQWIFSMKDVLKIK